MVVYELRATLELNKNCRADYGEIADISFGEFARHIKNFNSTHTNVLLLRD